MVRWQFSQALLLAMWAGPLPVARTPLWQLAQLLVTPAWDRIAACATLACTAPATLAASAPLAAGAVLPMVALTAGAPTTVATRVAVAATATTFRFWLPPSQLLGLWQPLQSWPTWWPLGRVVRLVTP